MRYVKNRELERAVHCRRRSRGRVITSVVSGTHRLAFELKRERRAMPCRTPAPRGGPRPRCRLPPERRLGTRQGATARAPGCALSPARRAAAGGSRHRRRPSSARERALVRHVRHCVAANGGGSAQKMLFLAPTSPYELSLKNNGSNTLTFSDVVGIVESATPGAYTRPRSNANVRWRMTRRGTSFSSLPSSRVKRQRPQGNERQRTSRSI